MLFPILTGNAQVRDERRRHHDSDEARRYRDSDEARRHHDRGALLYKAGRYKEAIAEFQAAYDIWQLPRLLYDIAQAERRLGDTVKALAMFERFLQADPNMDVQTRTKVDGYVAELRGMLPANAPPRPEEQPNPASEQTTEPEPPHDPVAPTPPLPIDPATSTLRQDAVPPAPASRPASAPIARPDLLVVSRPAVAMPARRPAWRIGTGATALALGSGLLGVGAWAVAVNGRCTQTCEYTYNSIDQGAAFLGVGAALMISGAVLIALPGKRLSLPLRSASP